MNFESAVMYYLANQGLFLSPQFSVSSEDGSEWSCPDFVGLDLSKMDNINTLEKLFHEAMINIHERALLEYNYRATYFLRMVGDYGGVQVAKRLLNNPNIQYGFEKLWECGKLDLTMECLVLQLDMYFKIKGTIREIKTIAAGHGIKNLNRLNKVYGKTNWRKLKEICHVELEDGAVFEAEVHWYEGHGVGKKEIKIKRYL